MSIHRFEPAEPHRPDEPAFDEREWQLQERALHDERGGLIAGDDPALADYRLVSRALRTPAPVDLPADFAAQVAACAAARARAEGRLEQVLTQALLAALGLAGGVVAVQSGGAWLRDCLAWLPPRQLGLALPWGLAVVGCLGLSWSMEQVRRRVHLPH